MASISKKKTPSGKFRCYIKRGGKIVASKVFPKRKDAVDWGKRKDVEFDRAESLGLTGAAVPFDKFAKEELEASERKDPTFAARVNWWIDRLGDKPLLSITKADIHNGLKAYSVGRKPATINRMRAALSTILASALDAGHIAENMVRLVPQKAENNERVRWLSDAERKRLLAACERSRWDKLALLVRMAIGTGARRAELLGLHWSDIDFERQTATLHTTKNRDPRTLPLPDAIMAELQPFRRVGKVLVFESRHHPGRPTAVRLHWEAALKAANVTDFRFHDLRHTAASYLAMGGASLMEIGDMLGHRSAQTSKRYAHLSTEHKAALAERLLGDKL